MAGHELACHTFSHRKLSSFHGAGLKRILITTKPCWDRSPKPRQAEFLRSFRHGLARHAAPVTTKVQDRSRHHARINRGSIDPYNLAGVELRADQNYLDAADRWLEDVLQNGGWLIIFTHDVSQTPSFYGCPEDKLQSLVRRAASGGAKIMTVDAAATSLGL